MDLTALRASVAEEGTLERSAGSTDDRITRKAESLVRFPMSGHVVPEYEGPGNEHCAVRQILEGNYRIIHRVWPDRIEVLTVIHGARELPPLESLE